MEPGTTITPGSNANNASPETQQPVTTQPATPKEIALQPTDEQDSSGFGDNFQDSQSQDNSPMISWTASEFIDHNKNAGWYLALVLSGGALTAIVYFATRDIITSAAIVIATASFAIFASRKPRTLNYTLRSGGITIGEKVYPYTNFKSFSLKEEGAIRSIDLMPLQRFMPGLTIYCPPDQEDQIVDALIDYLPHEERGPDLVDRFMRKIRF